MYDSSPRHLLMCSACCQAEKLVGRLDQLGATAGDLGLSLFKVAKFEVSSGDIVLQLFTASKSSFFVYDVTDVTGMAWSLPLMFMMACSQQLAAAPNLPPCRIHK